MMRRRGQIVRQCAESPPERATGRAPQIVLGVMIAAAGTPALAAPVVIEGTASADVIDVSSKSVPHEIYGRGGDDRITGSSAADTLDGGYGYDRLNGGPGSDTLIGGPGNDTLNGGTGTDDARYYSRSRAAYSVTGSLASFQVRALSGSDGTDTLSSIEFVDFLDGRYAVSDLLDGSGNRAPSATNDSASTAAGQSVIIEVLANDTDPDGDTLRVGSASTPAHGSVTVNADRSITYAPQAGFAGTDGFTYVVIDGRGGSDTGAVSVTVRAVSGGDALRSLIAAAPGGSWIKVNANRFEDVWTPLQQRARVDGSPLGEPRKIITAWGSMAWDDNRRQLIIWGGGHANYAGNDVYRFDAATLRWQRASLPSAVHEPLGDQQFFAVDGPMNAPTSSHTYDNQEFLPLADRFITFGGAKYNAGQVFVLADGVTRTGPYLWDPSRADANTVGGTTGSHVNPALFPNVTGGRMWQNRDTIANNGLGSSRPAWFVNGTTAYAVENGSEVIYLSESPRNGGDLFRYRIADVDDPASDTWQLIGVGAKSYADQGAGAYDPGRRIYLRTARFNSSFGIVMWNTATPGPQNGPLRFIPRDASGAAIFSNLHGMDFDPVRRVFVLWNGNGDVWYLRPPASGPAFTVNGWTATLAPVSGSGRPNIQMTTGILGKWKYIRSHDVMMGLGGGYEGQVWVYKPLSWQPP